MDYKDYYQALGIEPSADEAGIKKAYRKLIRKYHPDVSKEADADQRTKELNEAYGVLGDPEKRAAYDQLGKQPAGQPFQPPPDWGASFGGGGDINDSDFFADLFAHVGGARRRGGGFQMRGDDSHASIDIELADAYRGATRGISLRMPQADAQGRLTTRERTLDINIPAGVTEGQQLRLSGQGQPGSGGAPAGDLYLEIRFRPDSRYRVEGRDVFETVPLTPWEAALGGQIDVATPSGTVSVTVPQGSQNGRKLRLKGRGIPGKQPGDLYLLLEVALPPADTARARELYETMARELAFNPRQQRGT
ncbi:DnaJ C-terminal domain-containing protein [Janthinobacterium agaricidamnosum]|uniref:DnaJ domain protein n=1 Tax=Janthinobacterium agaricidamnosum NBRC 102515 = DSM 9628 TaxID=1349767 RepID=W0V7B4_9BURK|nr:DnaJ C-terminal domain-containing protein [Janthinobacterium agaricidamnosum]CDG84729.1 dnaJ domain protein [Janthinobacterium agaricidamnosum NBRC 102515 = DSM 9628]